MKFTKPNHYQNETNHNLMRHKKYFVPNIFCPKNITKTAVLAMKNSRFNGV